MTQPTISIFTDPKGLGRVYREQSQLIRKFAEVSTPFQGSTGKFALSILGATRIILIQCSQTGKDFDGADFESRIADFIYEMDEWVNAGTPSNQIYTDSFGNEYAVQPVDFTWTRVEGDSFRIAYSLLMKEVFNP